MVEAGYNLMSARGYADTTMAEIAEMAGVAVQTVYFTFRNKPGLLRAVWEFAVLGDHEPGTPVARPWFRALEQEPELETALGLALDGSLAIHQRVAPLASVFETFSADPEIREFERLDRQLKLDGYSRMLDVLVQKRDLRAGVARDDAVIVLTGLLSGDTYRAMVVRLGWEPPKWREWTIRTLADGLFAAAQPPGTGQHPPGPVPGRP